MSKELNSISGNVMNEIRLGRLKMRPKIYFIAGSILTFIGLVSSILSSVFLIGLLRFSLRTHGPMGEYRLAQIVESFPWWILILAILGLAIGLWLVRRYNFSYKLNFKLVVFWFIAVLAVAGYLLDTTGLNEIFYQRGYMNKIYKQENGINFGNGSREGRQLNHYNQIKYK